VSTFLQLNVVWNPVLKSGAILFIVPQSLVPTHSPLQPGNTSEY